MTGDLCTFVAVWPIVEMTTPAELIQEARADLAGLANQARAALMGKPKFSIRPGSEVPGSGGAEFVVCATAPAIEMAVPSWRR